MEKEKFLVMCFFSTKHDFPGVFDGVIISIYIYMLVNHDILEIATDL